MEVLKTCRNFASRCTRVAYINKLIVILEFVMNKNWDIFISHASEDKDQIVRELAHILTTLNLKVWYDEFSLNIGDSLTSSIDKGLNQSKYGLVIISKDFLNKKWTDYEYKSLITKEVNGVQCILPIWHNITRTEVQNFSLYLADKVALTTNNNSLKQIALKVCQVVRPEIIENIKGYMLFKEAFKNAKIEKVNISELKNQEKPLSKLSKSLQIRAKIIHYGIGQQTKIDFKETIYNYELDLRPEREIQTWEIMNSCYLEFLSKYNISDEKIKNSVYRTLLHFAVGLIVEKTELTIDQVNELAELWQENFYEY